MTPKLKTLAAATCSALALGWGVTATAQISDDVVKIGFITDISGPYSDTDGTGGVEAVKMAIEVTQKVINMPRSAESIRLCTLANITLRELMKGEE